jgi:hypothetical protein
VIVSYLLESYITYLVLRLVLPWLLLDIGYGWLGTSLPHCTTLNTHLPTHLFLSPTSLLIPTHHTTSLHFTYHSVLLEHATPLILFPTSCRALRISFQPILARASDDSRTWASTRTLEGRHALPPSHLADRYTA